MKIRQGFVSNSSSSSFIISHPKGEELTKESLHRAIFGSDEEQCFHPRYHDEFGVITSTFVTEYVLDAINSGHTYKTCGKISKEQIEEVCGGHYPPGIDVPDGWRDSKYQLPDGTADWEALDKVRHHAAALEKARILMMMQSADLYAVEIGDDSAWGSEMEHGDPLNDSPNVIRYSNH